MNRQETINDRKENKPQAERHRIALEKLQLSWMKITLTLSGIGFAAYRFFYSRTESGKAPLFEPFNGRSLGILLVSLAILGLLQATLQHAQKYAKLRSQHKNIGYSVTLVQSVILLILFGIILAIIMMKL